MDIYASFKVVNYAGDLILQTACWHTLLSRVASNTGIFDV